MTLSAAMPAIAADQTGNMFIVSFLPMKLRNEVWAWISVA
jgi:hypothetical protein